MKNNPRKVFSFVDQMLRQFDFEDIARKYPDTEILNLSYNCLQEVKGIENFKGLKELHLLNNWLTEFCEEILRLENLEVLSLAENKIQEVPADICQRLPKLRKIYLNNNRLRVMPKALFKHPALEHAELYNNPISDFPREMLPLNFADIKRNYEANRSIVMDKMELAKLYAGNLNRMKDERSIMNAYRQMEPVVKELTDVLSIVVRDKYSNVLISKKRLETIVMKLVNIKPGHISKIQKILPVRAVYTEAYNVKLLLQKEPKKSMNEFLSQLIKEMIEK
jgi:Leucine-rich repeat (LRR) protein